MPVHIFFFHFLFLSQTEVNEAKDEAQEQRERAARAERSYAKLLEEGRTRAASSCEGDGEDARSSKLQRELQAEEEGGGGGEKSSLKVGGLTQSYSKDGALEWKWLGNCPKVRTLTRGARCC